MNSQMKLGDRIAYYRRLNAMTQEELAKQLNISTQAVSKWEQKITSPDISLLPEIAELFGISIDELFGKTINTTPVYSLIENVPWSDDGKVRLAVYHGTKLMQQSGYELLSGTNCIKIHFDCKPQYIIHGICKLNKQ